MGDQLDGVLFIAPAPKRQRLEPAGRDAPVPDAGWKAGVVPEGLNCSLQMWGGDVSFTVRIEGSLNAGMRQSLAAVLAYQKPGSEQR